MKSYVVLLRDMDFYSDGTGNRDTRSRRVPAGTLCEVTSWSSVVWIRPAAEDSCHLWVGARANDIRQLTEMEVVAMAADGRLDDREWEAVA